MRALVLLLVFAAAASCFSQGTVNFANVGGGAGGSVNAPVQDVCGGAPGVLVAGDAARAQLYVGPAGISAGDVVNSALTTNGVSGTPASFQTGAQSGYFLGGERIIDGYVPGATVSLQVRLWATAAGNSWETTAPGGICSPRAESQVIQVVLGTLGASPNMVGLQSPSNLSIAPVPEPSLWSLAAVGLLTAAAMRRRPLRK